MDTTELSPGSTRTGVGPSANRTALMVAVPLLWVVVALVHPLGSGDPYEFLQDKVGRWLFVHFAQLVLALGLAAVLWTLLRGRIGRAATVARLALPVWLVTFTTFDAVTGLGSGLAVRHASSLSGEQRAGAASTVDYLLDNRFTGDLSPVWLLQAVALLTALVATALVLRSAGASRVVFVGMLVGTLLVFHAGPIAVVGLLAIAVATFLANREGLVDHAPSSR